LGLCDDPNPSDLFISLVDELLGAQPQAFFSE